MIFFKRIKIVLIKYIRFLIFIFLMCTSSILSAQSNMHFISTLKTDTVIAQDSILSSSFVFTNTGNNPLIITNMEYYPKSLRVSYESKPILPNQKSSIKVYYNPIAYPNGLKSLLKIYSNAKNTISRLNLNIKVKENPLAPYLLYNKDFDGIKFKEKNINFGDIIIGKSKIDSLAFYNISETTIKLETSLISPFFSITFKPSNIKPNQKAYMFIEYKKTNTNKFYGPYNTSFKLIINNKKYLFNKFYIYANFKEDFSKLTRNQLDFAPLCSLNIEDYDFGKINSGKKYKCKFIITNKGKSDLVIRKINTSCSCLKILCKHKILKPQQETSLEVTLDTYGKKGKILKAIYLTTNDPENPNITLVLKGVVI